MPFTRRNMVAQWFTNNHARAINFIETHVSADAVQQIEDAIFLEYTAPNALRAALRSAEDLMDQLGEDALHQAIAARRSEIRDITK
jgi:hypothetical protein